MINMSNEDLKDFIAEKVTDVYFNSTDTAEAHDIELFDGNMIITWAFNKKNGELAIDVYAGKYFLYSESFPVTTPDPYKELQQGFLNKTVRIQK